MKKAAISLVFLLILVSCLGQTKSFTYSDMLYKNIEYEEITFTLHKKTLDTIRVEGMLKSEAVIENIPCKGNVAFAPGGKLKKFTLVRACVFGNNTFPPDSHVELGIDLGRSSDINSLDNYFAIRNAGIRIINLCYFPDLQVIDGISCKGNESVFFNSDWNLLGCILAEADTVKGNLLPESTFVRFNYDGSLACFCLTDPEIQGYRCAGSDYSGGWWMGGGGIFFYPGGALKRFQPVDTVMIRGIVCKRSSVRGGGYTL